MIATGLMTLWAASTALGQLTFTVDGDDALRLGPSTCGTQSVAWTLSTTTASLCSSMRLWLTSGQCGDEADSSDLALSDIDSSSFSSGTGTVDVDLDDAFSQLRNLTCGTTTGVESTVRLCGSILTYGTTTGCSSSNVLRASALAITYDAKPPAAPTIDSVEGLDGTLLVTYGYPSDADSVTSQVRAQGEVKFTANATDSSVDGSLKLTGLSNRTTYDVQLFAVDRAGNTSSASALGAGTPVPTLGFFSQYKAAGGSEQGCQSATGALLWGAPAWLLWVRRRRRATL